MRKEIEENKTRKYETYDTYSLATHFIPMVSIVLFEPRMGGGLRQRWRQGGGHAAVQVVTHKGREGRP